MRFRPDRAAGHVEGALDVLELAFVDDAICSEMANSALFVHQFAKFETAQAARTQRSLDTRSLPILPRVVSMRVLFMGWLLFFEGRRCFGLLSGQLHFRRAM